MKSLKQVWAAAQRNPCAKRPSSGIGAEPKATITILINFDRTFLLIPTGCALRWAQKDEGGFPQPPYIPLDSHTPFGTPGSNKYVKESKVLSLCTRASKSQLCFCALKTGAV